MYFYRLYFSLFYELFDDIIQEGMILEKYGKFIDNKPIFKPLGVLDLYKCVGGDVDDFVV